MNIREIEYIKIPVTNLETTLRFYHEVFDMVIIDLPNGDKGAKLAKQYLDFVEETDHFHPITFGFVSKDPMDNIQSHLINYDVTITAGPGETVKPEGKANSISMLDPDNNRIEISVGL